MRTVIAANSLLLLGALVQPAAADPYYAERSDDGYARTLSESVWFDPALRSGIGVGMQAGGGVIGFVDSEMRETTGPIGGLWSLRGAFGTHTPLALELGYAGSATPIETEFGRADAVMIGTGVEAALRLSPRSKDAFSPYLFAGIGWQRYTIDDTAFQLSDVGIADQDDLLVVPLGVGFAYRVGAFVTDVRGTFRVANGADLVLEDPALSLTTGAGAFAPMHTWDASVNVGYEL